MSGKSSRLEWLYAALSRQYRKVDRLLSRLSGLRQSVTARPALLHKFMRLLEQVAAEKDEEEKLIGKIEAIEKRHFKRRRLGLLRRAAPRPYIGDLKDMPEPERPASIWVWLAILWYMFLRKGPKPLHKDQGLTPL